MIEQRIGPFDTAGRLFPLNYERRTGLAKAHIMLPAQTTPQVTAAVIRRALRDDPNSADLWYNLVRMDLILGDKGAYTADMGHLKKLTPQLTYQIVAPTEGPP
jgi:cytochrome c-type biogenesis protein CcmH/NrfG